MLFVTGSLTGGGAERCVSTLCMHLDPARFEVSVALFNDEVTYPIPDGMTPMILGATAGWRKLRVVRRLRRLIERSKPDVVAASHWHPGLVVGAALAICRHRPAFVSWVASPPQTGHESTWTNRRLLKLVYERADALVAVSDGVAESLRRYLAVRPEKIHRIDNPVDLAAVEHLSSEPQSPTDPEPMVLAVGRLSTVKRHDVLIEAFAHLTKEHTAKLVILGEGAMRATLAAQIARLGLQGRVTLPGFQKNPYGWMRRSRLFVLSSEFEGQGIVIAEAQSLSVPVIATDCDYGPRELIRDGETGLLVPPNRPDSLAAAMSSLLNDPKRAARIGAAGCRAARARFGAGDVAEKTSDLFTSLAHRRDVFMGTAPLGGL